MKNIFTTILCLASFPLLALQPTIHPAPQIINGITVGADDPIAKSTVMLDVQFTRYSFTCSGSIIAPDLIATAAHCLGPYNDGKITVFFGTDKNKSGISIGVKKQIMADYDSSQTFDRNDIGLLLLNEPIPAGYQPVPLLASTETLQANEMLTLAGYGVNVIDSSSSDDGGAGVLRTVDQNILNPAYGNTEILINIQGKGTCSGDSGGPAFVKKDNQLYLVGIASHMTDNDIVPGSKPVQYQCTKDIVYTNIVKQLAWYQWAETEIRK